MHTQFWSENLKGDDRFEYRGIRKCDRPLSCLFSDAVDD
jgi:hypothetical protein